MGYHEYITTSEIRREQVQEMVGQTFEKLEIVGLSPKSENGILSIIHMVDRHYPIHNGKDGFETQKAVYCGVIDGLCDAALFGEQSWQDQHGVNDEMRTDAVIPKILARFAARDLVMPIFEITPATESIVTDHGRNMLAKLWTPQVHGMPLQDPALSE